MLHLLMAGSFAIHLCYFKCICIKTLTDPYSRLLDGDQSVLFCCLTCPESLKHAAIHWTLGLDYVVVH